MTSNAESGDRQIDIGEMDRIIQVVFSVTDNMPINRLKDPTAMLMRGKYVVIAMKEIPRIIFMSYAGNAQVKRCIVGG